MLRTQAGSDLPLGSAGWTPHSKGNVFYFITAWPELSSALQVFDLWNLSWVAAMVCVRVWGAKCPCPLSQPAGAASPVRTFILGISKPMKFSFKMCPPQPAHPFCTPRHRLDSSLGSCFTICLLFIQKHFVYCKFESWANNDALFPCWSPKMINWALHKAAHWGRNVLCEVVLRGGRLCKVNKFHASPCDDNVTFHLDQATEQS